MTRKNKTIAFTWKERDPPDELRWLKPPEVRVRRTHRRAKRGGESPGVKGGPELPGRIHLIFK